MPRSARLDMPGLLQHVIVRGIEKRDIFRDDRDREEFLDRLSALLKETQTQCYAWSLLPNHFHLLVKPTRSPLALLMRRLLTGYAIHFNRRHGRSGHLFQNRYKSIVCEEEPYLLELIRYIHLNPIRAGLVEDLQGLDEYPWSGHAVLMGRRKMEGQEITSVLLHFGENPTPAQWRYRGFISDGLGLGRREALEGGGFRGSRKGKAGLEQKGRWDSRVLGGGEFVKRLQERKELKGRLDIPLPLCQLVDRVSETMNIDPVAIRQPSKVRALAEARAVICYLAIREYGYKGLEVGKELHLGPAGVSLAMRRGEALLRAHPEFKAKSLKIEK